MGNLFLRAVETFSLALKQSAELNGRLMKGEITWDSYVREAGSVWSYNVQNFLHPEADPATTTTEIKGRNGGKRAA